MKKRTFAAIAVTAAMAFGSLALCACNSEPKTYENSYQKLTDFGSKTYHTGYVSGAFGENASYAVTLEVNGSKYTLTKEVKGDSGSENTASIDLKFSYSGTCKASGETITLSVPMQCEWSENWGLLADAGIFSNGSGTVTTVDEKTENGDVIFNLFNGEFLNSSTCADQIVTVSETSITFEN